MLDTFVALYWGLGELSGSNKTFSPFLHSM